MKALGLLLGMAAGLSAELPGFYGQVDRIIFVVPSVDKAVAEWKGSGVVEVSGTRSADFEAEYQGKYGASSVRFAAGRFGDIVANWLEPVSGSNAFADFLKTHGPGVFAVMHQVGSLAEMNAEVTRMKGLGVGVVQRGPMGDDDSSYVLFDTRGEGKYTLGIYWMPQRSGPAPESARKVTQFAFIVRNEGPVAKYWSRLGWPVMSVTHPKLHGLEYKGKPGDFRARLGWMRHGKVAYEWIVPEKGPSTWHDHLERHGEGVHHLAFNVEDMDRAIAEWKQGGYAYAMGGAWGEPGKRGYGRFAYMDTQAAGGIDVELLWSLK